MAKFLLALLLTILAVLPPAGALCCAGNNTANVPECCANPANANAAINDLCCQMDSSDVVAPAISSTSVGTEQHNLLALADATDFSANWFRAETKRNRICATRPEHLASNKIYLLKRSLLI